ncbi:MAG: sugar transferase [Clostridia bacterium]|nr:sugar transferase [Clostridia bacterium]
MEELTRTEENPTEQKTKENGAKKFFLRALDIFAGVVLLVVLSWLILILMLVKYLEDFHNPLYISTRNGAKGKEFKLIKLRTMCIHADELEVQLNAAGLNEAEPPKFVLKNDPRITAVGNVYRKYRLDKLPALINVIAGDITIFDIFTKNNYKKPLI